MFFAPKRGDIVRFKRTDVQFDAPGSSDIGCVVYVLDDGNVSVLWSRSNRMTVHHPSALEHAWPGPT